VKAKHRKSSGWIQGGVFAPLCSFAEFESRVNAISEEKDRGDVFEIFIEGYLATQSIAQCKEHWVVGSIPLALRERYNLPSDGTGIDGIYEATDGTHVASVQDLKDVVSEIDLCSGYLFDEYEIIRFARCCRLASTFWSTYRVETASKNEVKDLAA